jgi:hypothetical protein
MFLSRGRNSISIHYNAGFGVRQPQKSYGRDIEKGGDKVDFWAVLSSEITRFFLLGTLLFDQSENYKICISYWYVLAYKIWWESNILFDSYGTLNFELWTFFLAALPIFQKNRTRKLTHILTDLYKLQKNRSKNIYSDLLFEKMGQKSMLLDFLATLSMDFFQNLISS